jgi:hypothetical protein
MATEALPPQLLLYQMAIGHYVSHALHLAVKLGIADKLKDGPKAAPELAEATSMQAAALKRLLRLLTTVGVFAEQGNGAFVLTPVGECLRTDRPGSAAAMVKLFAGPRMLENWKELEYCVRTGEPVFRKRGLSGPFAERSANPEEGANFDAAMADLTRMLAVAVAAAYDFKPFKTLVDVGGGNGTLLLGILDANPHLHGTVFDLPGAAERARENIAARGLAERCQAVGGDFFKEVPGGADAYILKHVIHDWNDEDALMILETCRRAMPANGKLLIVEGVYPPRVDQSPESRAAAANDVNMLVSTGGRQRSEAEFHALYDAAGFKLTRIVETMARIGVIEGVKA